jgi:hypothetical protein
MPRAGVIARLKKYAVAFGDSMNDASLIARLGSFYAAHALFAPSLRATMPTADLPTRSCGSDADEPER